MDTTNNLTLQNCNEALESVQKKIQSGKDLHLAYNQLGAIYGLLKQYQKAEEYFNLAVKIKSDYAAPYLNLGIIYNDNADYVNSINCFEKALRLENNNPIIYYNYAVAMQELGDINKAIEYYKKAIYLNPNHTDAHFNKGLLDLLIGNYTDGWKEYEDWGYISGNRKKRQIRGLLWQGESYIGKTLYVYCDQGFGDSINYFRYLPYIKNLGGNLIFESPQKLYNLFENKNIYFDFLTTPEKTDSFTPDFNIPLTSIPALFYNKNIIVKTEFPYLTIKNNINKYWDTFIEKTDKIKIGFLWKGNPYPPINQKRHAKLEDFYPLFDIPNTVWYSFLFEEDSELQNISYSNIIDLTKNINNFEDTAAILDKMDIVITIDSGLAHLAGALNKKTLLMLPFVPDWRWNLNSEVTLLYPSFKLFRQNSTKKWASVIENIKKYLEAELFKQN
ncbi:MAG: tetratricopeptide repeat protein [bacterium]